MSDVSAVSGVSTATNSSAAAAAAQTVNYNDFLQLLMAQLKTQDPTKPIDSTAFMSQLASFSQVEQGVNTNTKLDSLLSASALSQAESAIGRTLTAADGSTSGVIVSVKVTDQGAQATLDNGNKVLLASGVVLS